MIGSRRHLRSPGIFSDEKDIFHIVRHIHKRLCRRRNIFAGQDDQYTVVFDPAVLGPAPTGKDIHQILVPVHGTFCIRIGILTQPRVRYAIRAAQIGPQIHDPYRISRNHDGARYDLVHSAIVTGIDRKYRDLSVLVVFGNGIPFDLLLVPLERLGGQGLGAAIGIVDGQGHVAGLEPVLFEQDRIVDDLPFR